MNAETCEANEGVFPGFNLDGNQKQGSVKVLGDHVSKSTADFKVGGSGGLDESGNFGSEAAAGNNRSQNSSKFDEDDDDDEEDENKASNAMAFGIQTDSMVNEGS